MIIVITYYAVTYNEFLNRYRVELKVKDFQI